MPHAHFLIQRSALACTLLAVVVAAVCLLAPTSIAWGADTGTAETKSAIPTLKKEVGEGDEGTATYGKRADACINARVSYRLTGTLPDDYDSWSVYPYAFIDTCDPDMAVDKDTVTATAYHDGSETLLADPQVTVKGRKLTVAWDDLKQAAPDLAFGDEIIVTYKARIKYGTKKYGQKNPFTNSAVLSYPDRTTGGMTQTEPVQCHVYTYVLQVQKLSADGKTPLNGAQFMLTNANRTLVYQDGSSARSDAVTATNHKGRWVCHGIDAGSYCVEEVSAPKGYKALKNPIKVTIRSNVTGNSDRLKLSVKAKGAKVASVDAAKGIIRLQVTNEKASEDSATSTSSEGGAYHKTGNPFIDYGWAVLVIASVASLLVAYGIHTRRKKR